jgi:hypothetical protein
MAVPVVELLVTLIVIGVVLYFITMIPMDAVFQQIIRAVCIIIAVILVIFFILSMAGIGGMPIVFRWR